MSSQVETRSIHDHNEVQEQAECIKKHRDSRAERRERLKNIRAKQTQKQPVT